MLSPIERKKAGFPLLTSHASEMKKYAEVYSLFVDKGYSKELCEAYADAFIDNVKKPTYFDLIQIASLYEKCLIIHLYMKFPGQCSLLFQIRF